MPSRPLVLIVDDNPDNIEVLGEILADIADIGFALSGSEALTQMDGSLPDLILLDVMMPDMDGFAVIDAIKGDPRLRELPVIFVTAKNDSESETRGLAAGAVDFIHKPINRAVTRARVGVHLELLRQRRELEQRVAERTAVLRDALQRAEMAQRSKATFIANMSHELRTPLNTILGLAFIVGRQLGDPTLQEKIADIRSAGLHLLGLVDNILDVARLEAGTFHIEHIDFAVDAMLDACEYLLREKAAGKGLQLVRDIAPDFPPHLRGDPLRIGQILGNLLDNAIKFTAAGCITLRARVTQAHGETVVVRFEVADPGIGIGSEQLAGIFDNFAQADGSFTRRHGGAGLGLAICKQLAELLGGSIGVSSVPERGSTFHVTLTLARCARPLTMAPAAPPDVGTPATAAAAAGGDVDWDQARRIVGHLSGLLAEDDMAAQTLWRSAPGLLDAILGAHGAGFAQAMAGFDFPHALELLQASVANCPQLMQRANG